MPNINWFKVISAVSLFILAGLILFGAYQFYFVKPVPVVNNYIVSGNMTQDQKTVTQQRRLFTGLYGNKNEVGGMIGWMW